MTCPPPARQRFAGTALVLTQQAADRAVAVLAVLLVAASVLTVIRLAPAGGVRRGAPAAGRAAGRRAAGTAARYLPDVSVRDPGLQRGGGHRRHHPVMVASRYRGRSRSSSSTTAPPTAPPASSRGLRLPYVRVISQPNSGQAGRAQPRHRRSAQRHPGPGRRRHHLPGRTPSAAWSRRWRPPTSARSAATPRSATARGFLGRWQHLEYVMGFNLDRRLFDLLGTIPTVPGAIGAFRRAALAAVGGVSTDTLAEDTDLTMALCRSPLARRLRAGRHRLDRGAVQPAPALAAALPVVLRHDAGHVEEPARGHRARAVRQVRPLLPHLPGPLPCPAAADRAGGGRLLDLRPGLPQPGAR